MAETLPGERRLRTKVGLAVGFVAIALATLLAHSAPARGYELSLYAGTPRSVWFGLAVALLVALFGAFSATGAGTRGVRAGALALGGLATAVFVAVPIVRGYHYYGTHDALTHLGWTRAVSDGGMSPFELTYPGVHTTATLLGAVTGMPIERALLFVVLLATLVFVVFVPLCVGTIVDDPLAVVIATFSAFLLLPITTLATHMSVHAMTQAVFFAGLLVYLLTKYVLTNRSEEAFTAVGAALALTSIAAVIYHPQLVAHLLVVLLGICLVQYALRRGDADGPAVEHRPVYGQTLFLFAAFVVWTADRGFYVDTLSFFLESAAEFFFGTGEAGASIASQGASLSAIGVGFWEIFLKLFFPHLVFVVLTGALVLAVLVRVVSTTAGPVPAVTTYFTAGLVGLTVVFGIYFVGSGSQMYFRVFGLMMVFAVVLGSLALHRATVRVRGRPRGTVNAALAIAFGGLLVLSLLAVFPSPYIYNASPHVTEAQVNGYEVAFQNQDEEIELMGLRNGPNRYHDAVNGNDERMRLYTSVPESALEEPLAPQYESEQYLVLTAADHGREVGAYQELRYTEEELNAVAAQPGVDRVQSNDEFDLYLIRGTEEADE